MSSQVIERMPGRPIQIAEPIPNDTGEEDCERFQFNHNLPKLISSPERLANARVAVISVAGAFRKGKSFLLNFFLRYLRAQRNGDTSDWIHSADELSDGFHWRSGSDRDTAGIHIWSEPFFIPMPNGEEVAVLLMDTQGTFDHQSTQQDCTTIFAFSTLLSSVQIFNISQNIQETDLQHLRLFVEFAAMASDSRDRVLQRLWFLIRDWPFEDEYAFGYWGGKSYLGKVMRRDVNKPPENQELRAGIIEFFEQTDCYLLPHPGRKATRADFHGELDQLETDFVRELERFVPLILSADNLVIKSVNGRPLTGQELFNYAGVYFETFRSGKLPSPRTIFGATVEVTNIAVTKTCREEFDKQVQSRVDPSSAISDDQLDLIFDSAMRDVLNLFDKKCMQRASAATNECKEKLTKDLRDQFHHHRLMNGLRSDKIAAEKKNQMLAEDIQHLQDENVESVRRMRQMEEEFQEKVKRIAESSVSKEEMESLLEKESLRHRLAQQEMEAKNSQLASKIEMMSETNSDLLKQMKESEEERRRQEKRMQEQMEDWKKQREEEERRRLESNNRSELFLRTLTALAPLLQPLVASLSNGIRRDDSADHRSQGSSHNPGSVAQQGDPRPAAAAMPAASVAARSPARNPQETASGFLHFPLPQPAFPAAGPEVTRFGRPSGLPSFSPSPFMPMPQQAAGFAFPSAPSPLQRTSGLGARGNQQPKPDDCKQQ